MWGCLLAGADERLLAPPVNVLRLALSPTGLAPRIVNFDEWSAHLLDRLRRQVVLTGHPNLSALHDELAALPNVAVHHEQPAEAPPALALPLRLCSDLGELSFVGTVTTFGAALDVTLSELTLETFLPADGQTAEALRSAHRLIPGQRSCARQRRPSG